MRPGTLLRWQALQYILKSEVESGMFILDVGGYDGNIVYNIKKRFIKTNVMVVDLDQSGLKSAREKRLNVICASGLRLPVRDNSIDIALYLDVIEHIEDDEGLVAETSRVLKRGGKIFLTTPYG